VVEGTVCPTTTSSPDAAVRGILAAGLEQRKKFKTKPANRRQKYPIPIKLATYLSLVVWEELQRFLATDRAPLECSVWVSILGVGLSSLSLLSLAASSTAQPSIDISTVYMKIHMSILELG